MTHRKNCLQAGFTFIEILVVLFLLLILVSVAVLNFATARRNVKTNIASNITFSLLQQARQSAITSRRQHRVTISRSATPTGFLNRINIASIDPVDGTANIVREEYLPKEIIVSRPPDAVPTGSPRPLPADATFDAALPNGNFAMVYNADGSITDDAGNPLTGTIFFSDIPLNVNLPLTRALSFYSSTGEVKYWFYDGAKFVSGPRNN